MCWDEASSSLAGCRGNWLQKGVTPSDDSSKSHPDTWFSLTQGEHAMRYAVAHMSFFDNDLKVKVVKGVANWKGALAEAFDITADDLPDAMEEAQEEAFNQDWLFDAVEIPD